MGKFGQDNGVKPQLSPIDYIQAQSTSNNLSLWVWDFELCYSTQILYMHKQLQYSEEIKYLNTLLFCKFSYLEIMEGSEIVIVGACPLWKT